MVSGVEASNRERLSSELVLKLPGFSRFCSIGVPELDAPATVLAPAGKDVTEWFDSFVNRVESAIRTRTHLPIYRMGDGEYSILVGAQLGALASARRLAGRILRGRPAHRSGDAVYGFEEYTARELVVVRSLLVQHLSRISRDGILAMALHPRNPGFAKFIAPVLDRFDSLSIALTERNYAPFYFVYALLCGIRRRNLFEGRHVLTVTGDSPGKFDALRNGLRALGVASAEFLPCHGSKAMLGELDLSRVVRQPDIVLVGAGIGSASVLNQLVPLETVCIDAGYCLTVISRPEVPRRAYALPDEEFDRATLADIPPSSVTALR